MPGLSKANGEGSRKREKERGSLAQKRFAPDCAMVLLDDAFDDGKTQAHAVAGGMRALPVAIKDVLELLVGNAGARCRGRRTSIHARDGVTHRR